MRNLKKDKGNIAITGIAILFCIVLCGLLMIYAFYYNDTVSKRSKIDQVMRTYIERMETTGYLTDEQRNDLISDLTESGCSNIVFGTNTTTTLVPYGSYIYLEVTFDVSVTKFQSTGGIFNTKLQTEVVRTHKNRKGTAKY